MTVRRQIPAFVAAYCWLMLAGRFALFLSVFALAVRGEPVKTVRVALLCDSTDAAVAGFVEQVEVQLSRQAGVEVLDRANIRKVWQEQALSLEQAAIGETAVKVGKSGTEIAANRFRLPTMAPRQ